MYRVISALTEIPSMIGKDYRLLSKNAGRHGLRGLARVIRRLCYLGDTARATRAEIERDPAFFRKHRNRMRYHTLKEEGVAIGLGVSKAACTNLLAQRSKRHCQVN